MLECANYLLQRATEIGAQNFFCNTLGRNCRQGPGGRKRDKGGVSGPAEDLRLVSEVEAGVNFRPAGGVRGQVAGSLSGWGRVAPVL